MEVILVLSLSLGCMNVSAQMGNTPAKTAHSGGDKVENGRRIFASQGCDKCHGAAGQGGSGTGVIGPRISPPQQSFSAFTALIREPKGQMPPYSSAKLTHTDLADVYAFLKLKEPSQESLSSEGTRSAGNAQNGKALYASYGCYDCHGRYAQGSTATGPRLAPLPLSFDGFVSYLRHPAGDMPPYTSKVVPDSELADIFAFLQSLPAPAKVESIPLLK